MGELLNAISMVMGYCVVGFIIIGICCAVYSIIESKIVDIKTSKTTIQEGTVFYVDGEQVILKQDLNIRFRKQKVIVCECDELKDRFKYSSRGYCLNVNGRSKEISQSDFESKLLELYKNNKNEMSYYISKTNKK